MVNGKWFVVEIGEYYFEDQQQDIVCDDDVGELLWYEFVLGEIDECGEDEKLISGWI